MIRRTPFLLLTLAAFTAFGQATAPVQRVELERNSATVTLEPYAPNIVRVTISTIAKEAKAAPGFGFIAAADDTGWKHETGSDGGDTYTSPRMMVAVAPTGHRTPGQKLPDNAKFFSG